MGFCFCRLEKSTASTVAGTVAQPTDRHLKQDAKINFAAFITARTRETWARGTRTRWLINTLLRERERGKGRLLNASFLNAGRGAQVHSLFNIVSYTS